MSDKKIIAVIGATGAQGGGLARAILADPAGAFGLRAITRHPDGEKAKALAAQGAEVVFGDADDPASLGPAFAGAYGAFCVTNFWEHFSPERELEQAAAMARATRRASLSHVVWSTLEDTRRSIALDDPTVPTLREIYKVPHFDAKGQADALFAAEAAPTTFMRAAFYWENFIQFGMAPRVGDDGNLVLAMPLGGVPLPGMAAEDFGRCAYSVFQRGPASVGEYIGIAGEAPTGPEMAATFARHLGRPVSFYDVPFDAYRALGFPGADDLGNMFQFQALMGDVFQNSRSVEASRALYPQMQSFDAWLGANVSRIPIE